MIRRFSVAPCESVNSEPSVIDAGNQPLRASIARRSSPCGSLISATCGPNTIVGQAVGSYGVHDGMPPWFGFPLRANATHAWLIAVASASRSLPVPVMNEMASG